MNDDAPSTASTPPTVLVVEDREQLLRSRLRLLASHGVRAVGAPTAEHAAAYLAASDEPISMAVIDVNLREADPTDRSGLALARLLRSSGMSMLVVGYSAQLGENDLSDRDRSEFQAWFDKGRLRAGELDETYTALARLAWTAGGARMERTRAASDAVVSFLASTQPSEDLHVRESRAYLKALVGARAYDPFESAGPYDPFDGEGSAYDPHAMPPMPSRIADAIIVEQPDTLDAHP